MNDCPNAEMRDRLPDLIHERLEKSVRAVVVAHVADCIDCQEELELLRDLRGALVSRAPRVDVAYIVSALPKPPRVPSVTPLRARQKWTDWRVAAAATLLIVGGSSVVLVNRTQPGAGLDTMGTEVATARVAAPTTSKAPNLGPSVDSPATASSRAGAQSNAVAGKSGNAASGVTPDVVDEQVSGVSDARLAGLNARQLKALLGQLDQMQALPATDPEPVSMRVSATNPDVPEVEW